MITQEELEAYER